MDEIEQELKTFFDHWFAGFARGLDALDEAFRKQVLHACGRACAQSYTVAIFREVRARSADLDAFLQALSQRLPDAHYERASPNAIRVTYDRCGCDLVRLGLVRSPALCECSAADLRENLEQALDAPVTVELHASILRGGPQCVFTAAFADENPAGK